jgi:hypothetical protein
MDKAQAQALLEKKLGVQGHTDEIAELPATLEYMPLAIVQAAAYVSQRAPLFLVRQYRDEFKKSERKKTSVLYRDEPAPPRLAGKELHPCYLADILRVYLLEIPAAVAFRKLSERYLLL